MKKLKKCADYKFKRAKHYYVVTLSYHQTTTQQLFHNQLSCVLLLLWRQLFDEVWLLERELFYVIIYFKMLWVGWFSNFYITYFTIFQSFNSSLKINLVSVYSSELLKPRGCWKSRDNAGWKLLTSSNLPHWVWQNLRQKWHSLNWDPVHEERNIGICLFGSLSADLHMVRFL